MMINEYLKRITPNVTIGGNLFPEQLTVLACSQYGNSIKIIGRGLSGQLRELTINENQFDQIEIIEQNTFSGDPVKFRLVIEALRLGLAYEYDPFFSLSIAKIAPLPHQLEAVYDYFLKLPRIRFLLADDPGAGKTIMAGLLIKELKARGVIKRILIVTPANLTFQWQREMKDKFREKFEIIRGDILRANYGSNPWTEKDQVITSVSWASLQEDARESLLRSTWDLVIVDEAHKMSAVDDEHKTYAYQLGEALSEKTDHLLLMTATPHKGDPEHFRLFLKLLDRDVYADIASLDEAILTHEAPFYLRRVKEALVTFPDEEGVVKSLFTKRIVQTIPFQIESEEYDFYHELTKYVEDQSFRASADSSARARAIGFTMAMLQRRFASSLYAVRRSLERMKCKREEILKDPEGYRQKQIENKLPDNFEDLPEEEQQNIVDKLEEVVASFDPNELKIDIACLEKLITQAKELETKEIESKIVKLKETLTTQGVFDNKKMKMLIFTEHKDTLDYLAGDGQDSKPLGKLIEWGLKVTQIHGSMKIGDRNTPKTRIFAEREFKEDAQVLVATEAAGEGINLQFCWFMLNFDIPWNPMRLEQRMGRIHRYGQEKDCLILNFVSTNTREGRVLQKLFDRITEIENDIDPGKTGKVFNVLGDIFPSNLLEKMLRDMYSRNFETEQPILDRIIKDIDTERFRSITNSTLEGLAKKELNLSAIIGKSAEAKERRLVPEVVEDFFNTASPYQGIKLKEKRKNSHIYTVGRIPRNLWHKGNELEGRFGILGKEYKDISFSKDNLEIDPTLEWITPGHPLFEVIRETTITEFQPHLKKGTVFYDINAIESKKLDTFEASVVDGIGNLIHKRLWVVESHPDGTLVIKQPTVFLDLLTLSNNSILPDVHSFPDENHLEQFLVNEVLQDFLQEIQEKRRKETVIIEKHLDLSLNELINKQNIKLAEYIGQKERGDQNPSLHSNISQTENRIMELYNRQEKRKMDLARERQCTISGIIHLGSAWVLPHPEKDEPSVKKMISNQEVEAIAVQKAIEYEESIGYKVESVENDNKGFDLISRKYKSDDPSTVIDIKFIEVKGRAYIGDVALTSNELKTARRLKNDYYLYVVFNCLKEPSLYVINNPALIDWQPFVKIEHYIASETAILSQAKLSPEIEKERKTWYALSSQGVNLAFAEDKPDYSNEDLRKFNNEYRSPETDL